MGSAEATSRVTGGEGSAGPEEGILDDRLLGGWNIWIDANGNGVQDSNEFTTCPTFNLTDFDVDDNGNIRIANGGTGACVSEFICQGINGCGAPIYSGAAGSFIPYFFVPASIFQGTWGLARLRYLAATDTMYLLGATSPNDPNGNYGGTVCAYANWSTSPTQAGSAMTINHISLDIGTSISGNIQCAIYSDSSSKPGSLLMGTNALNNPGTGWQTFTLTSSQALTSGTYYWLLFWSAANYSVQNTTASGSSWYRSLTYGTWPSSAGSGTTRRAHGVSMATDSKENGDNVTLLISLPNLLT